MPRLFSPQVPDFDEWVDYCFTYAYADWSNENDDANDERTQKFVFFSRPHLAQYLIRLFESPARVAEHYTDEQIGRAVHVFFGIATEWYKLLRCPEVPIDLQVRCYTSVGTLYTDLLNRVCCGRGAAPMTDFIGKSALDGAVYMIWDMDCIEGGPMFHEKWPYLVEPAFGVLERVLKECRTSTCHKSALHGLGHLRLYHPERCRRLIDAFLLERDPPEWLGAYAVQARDEGVM